MTLNCIHIFIVTDSFLYWCVMRPTNQRFFIHSYIYLRILIISYLAKFLGTNSLYVLMYRKAVNQSINQSINQSTVQLQLYLYIVGFSIKTCMGQVIQNCRLVMEKSGNGVEFDSVKFVGTQVILLLMSYFSCLVCHTILLLATCAFSGQGNQWKQRQSELIWLSVLFHVETFPQNVVAGESERHRPSITLMLILLVILFWIQFNKLACFVLYAVELSRSVRLILTFKFSPI